MRLSSVRACDLVDHVLLVGRDIEGRWAVQENHGLIDRRFGSREAAVRFALRESRAFPGVRVNLTGTPLNPILAR